MKMHLYINDKVTILTCLRCEPQNALAIQVTGEGDEEEDSENRWGGDDEDDEDTFFDMDEFVLQESTGYMLPTLRFLAVFHTVISLLCLVGYYCLKVGVFSEQLRQTPE